MRIGIPWEQNASRRALVRVVGWATLLAIVVPFQSVLIGVGEIMGVVPNVPLIVLVFFSIRCGWLAGAVAGVALGFALDLISAGDPIFYTAVYALVGMGSGALGRVTANPHLFVFVPLLFAVSLFVSGVHIVWFQPFDRAEEMVQWIVTVLLPQTVYDVVLGAVVYLVWIWWYPPVHESAGVQHDFFSSGRFPGSV